MKDESEHYSEEYLRAVELEVEAARLNSVGSLDSEHPTGIYTVVLARRVPMLIRLLRSEHERAEREAGRRKLLEAELAAKETV